MRKKRKGSPGCNPGLSQTTGNHQGKHTIQNNKAHPFIVGVVPCVDPPGEYQPRITPNGNRTKHPHQNFHPRKPQNQPQECRGKKKWAAPNAIRIDPTRPPLLKTRDSPPRRTCNSCQALALPGRRRHYQNTAPVAKIAESL